MQEPPRPDTAPVPAGWADGARRRLTQPSVLAALGTLLVLGLVGRVAWVSDDAFITLRTVDHFVNGRGLVWNTGFRVQAYTHPAWLLLLAVPYAITREPYLTTLAVSLVTTAVAVFLLLRDVTRSTTSRLAAIALLAGSTAFVEYGTSGLENPLAHLLVVLALRARGGATPSLVATCGWLGLLALTRHDLAVLMAPLALESLVSLRGADARTRRRALLALTLPLGLFTAFSLVYYGAPVPNTAYAKLGGALPRATLVENGLGYVQRCLHDDPTTIVALALCLFAGLTARARAARVQAAGIALYVAYVVWVGGDFMRGRFFTAPLVLGVVWLGRRVDALDGWRRRALGLAALCAGLASPLARVAPGSEQAAAIDALGIADERAHWAQATGIEHVDLRDPLATHPHVVEARARAARARAGGPRVYGTYTAGFAGYYAGPDVYLVEWFGLTDPLLARQPAMREVHTRPGHLLRHVDDDYVAMLDDAVAGRPFVCRGEPVRCGLLRDVLTVTHGPIVRRARFEAIVRLLRGRVDWGSAFERYQRPHMPVVQAADVASPFPGGTPFGDRRLRRFRDDGLLVRLPGPTDARTLELSVDHNDRHRVVFRRGGTVLGTRTIGARTPRGLAVHRVSVPAAAVGVFDEVLVEPTEGDGLYALGHLRVVPDR